MVITDIDHPTIPWSQSTSKTLMLIALRNGNIPRKPRDDAGLATMSIDDIWTNFCPLYSRKKLPSRLAALRKIVDRELTANGFKEPNKWKHSAAYKLLARDIRNGKVPVDNPDSSDWETIYLMHPEYAAYDDAKFKERLKHLRQQAKRDSNRALDDEAAFDAFVMSHPISYFSLKGYDQWQGSKAQLSIWKDIEDNKHTTMHKKDLYGSRQEYYEHFPLSTFRDKLKQEIKTQKWRHTLEVKGKPFKSS